MFSGLDERVIDIIERFGYTGIALLIALETIFPPLPSEIILPLGGFTA
jgi:membrane protein DedA with SNARE-associated domain